MAADQPNTARAALMRLRDYFAGQAGACNASTDWWDGHRSAFQHAQAMVTCEIAALPADEAAGASAGLVEAVERISSLHTHEDGTKSCSHARFNGDVCGTCRALRNALAAERARKPQPDERDKTIAELNSQVSYLLETLWPICDATGTIRDAVAARQIPLYIDGMRQRAVRAENLVDGAEKECWERLLKIDELKENLDERDKTILDMLKMHNDTERVLDEFGLLHDVKASLPDQVRAVCKEVVELREKLRQAEEAAEYANAYQSDLAAITATMDRLDYPFHPERQDRNDTIGRLGEMWNHLHGERQRAEKAEAEAARYRETLVSKHGGEPMALLDELDELRAVGELRERLRKLAEAVKAHRSVKMARHVEWHRTADEVAAALAEAEKVLKT